MPPVNSAGPQCGLLGLSTRWVNSVWHWVCHVTLQFNGGITAKDLKIWELVEEIGPRRANNVPMGCYPLLKKYNLDSWEKAAFSLGQAEAAEQGKKQ